MSEETGHRILLLFQVNDEIAESEVLLIEYGGVPEFLARHSYALRGKNPGKA